MHTRRVARALKLLRRSCCHLGQHLFQRCPIWTDERLRSRCSFERAQQPFGHGAEAAGRWLLSTIVGFISGSGSAPSRARRVGLVDPWRVDRRPEDLTLPQFVVREVVSPLRNCL